MSDYEQLKQKSWDKIKKLKRQICELEDEIQLEMITLHTLYKETEIDNLKEIEREYFDKTLEEESNYLK